jgi:hypothetical protein
MRRLRLPILVILLLALSACAPRTRDPLNSPQAQATDKIAQEVFHRMEIGKLQTGDYTTNALVDLRLPQGVTWTLTAFGSGAYQISVTSQEVPGYTWLVSPEGVRFITVAPAN